MQPAASRRTSAARAAWVVAALFAGVLAMLLVPRGRESAPPDSMLPPIAALSRLQEVGLPNNPDWTGLPEYFAVWAPGLNWREGFVVFAYWNAGANDYADYFRAERRGDRFVFRPLTRGEVDAWADEYLVEDREGVAGRLADRAAAVRTHPFIFLEPTEIVVRGAEPHTHPPVDRTTPAPKVEVEIPAERLKLPADTASQPKREGGAP